MSLNNPQVQIVRKQTHGEADKYFLYVMSHFISSDYESDGQDDLPEIDDGTLTVTLKVTRTGEALRFNKTVIHQISLDGVDFESLEQFNVVVKEGTTELASTVIVYQDESETVIKPIHI